jgi:hypothetical protein
VTEKYTPPDCIAPCLTPESACDASSLQCSGGITLEQIIDATDEMSHLNELILLHIEKLGGFTTTEAYFAMVQPVLDLLEAEIKIRYWTGMTKQDMKLVVQDWVDSEIARLHKRG